MSISLSALESESPNSLGPVMAVVPLLLQMQGCRCCGSWERRDPTARWRGQAQIEGGLAVSHPLGPSASQYQHPGKQASSENTQIILRTQHVPAPEGHKYSPSSYSEVLLKCLGFWLLGIHCNLIRNDLMLKIMAATETVGLLWIQASKGVPISRAVTVQSYFWVTVMNETRVDELLPLRRQVFPLESARIKPVTNTC